MKLAVVGSRSFSDYEFLSNILNQLAISEIISGGAVGADTFAIRYASSKNIPVTIFLPQWKLYGKSAGFVRNNLIVENCDYLIAFWDGKSKGTAHSIDLAIKKEKLHSVHIVN